MSYLSALEVCSRRGAIQIHVYLYVYLYLQTLGNTVSPSPPPTRVYSEQEMILYHAPKLFTSFYQTLNKLRTIVIRQSRRLILTPADVVMSVFCEFPLVAVSQVIELPPVVL